MIIAPHTIHPSIAVGMAALSTAAQSGDTANSNSTFVPREAWCHGWEHLHHGKNTRSGTPYQLRYVCLTSHAPGLPTATKLPRTFKPSLANTQTVTFAPSGSNSSPE